MPADLRGLSVPYRPRVVDDELRRRLKSSGAVLIEGPKACGKTVTGEQAAASAVYLDVEPLLRDMAEVDPSQILGEGEPRPRLIDEWQTAPAIWNQVRRAVDLSGGKAGQFILTGSAVPPDDLTRHTGAGRISRLRMRPMSLFESGHSSGEVSLGEVLAEKKPPSVRSQHTVADIAERITVGGWPALVSADPVHAAQAVSDYIQEVCRTDLHRLDSVRRDPKRVMRVVQSVARNVATEAATTVITEDAGIPSAPGVNEGTGPSRLTVIDYLDALERLMVIEDQPAWAPHIRSKVRLRSSAKRHFVDPSIAVAALGTGVEGLLSDLNYLGYVFESLVVRDLRVYSQHNDGEVFHYRDETGLEVDAIIKTRSGSWAAFEVKLGGEALIDKAATSLLKFAEKVDAQKMGQPARLAVIVANGYGYTRTDGVAVIPIGALGP